MPSKLDDYLANASPEAKEKLREAGKGLESTVEAKGVDNAEPATSTPRGTPSGSGKLSKNATESIEGAQNAPDNGSYNKSSKVDQPTPPKDSMADKYPVKETKPNEPDKSQDKEPER